MTSSRGDQKKKVHDDLCFVIRAEVHKIMANMDGIAYAIDVTRMEFHWMLPGSNDKCYQTTR